MKVTKIRAAQQTEILVIYKFQQYNLFRIYLTRIIEPNKALFNLNKPTDQKDNKDSYKSFFEIGYLMMKKYVFGFLGALVLLKHLNCQFGDYNLFELFILLQKGFNDYS